MVKRYTKQWVLPEFKQKFKLEACKRGMTTIDLQRDILKQNDSLYDLFNKPKRKRKNEFII